MDNIPISLPLPFPQHAFAGKGIIGVGCDVVDIQRSQWQAHGTSQLEKIFSQQEITHCLSSPRKSAERFSVRFAAKEAFYKALPEASQRRPFFTICRAVQVISKKGRAPVLVVDWNMLELPPLKVHISLTHGLHMAMAFVILEQIE